MKDFMDTAVEAARAGGAVLNDMRSSFEKRQKAAKDFVTTADLAAQRAIRAVIRGSFPTHGFVGEEDTGAEPPERHEQAAMEYCWIVDPLDGTMNYVHQLPGYAVSIALRKGTQLLVGVVYDPVAEEWFTAQYGAGAQLNGAPISSSDCSSLEDALIAVSLPAVIPRDSAEITRLLEVLHAAQSIRRLGSAALNLSYVAMGRLDGYWATAVKPWDVAAGALIVTEAGAKLTHFRGGPFDLDNPRFVAAANETVHRELMAALARGDQLAGSEKSI